MESRLLLCSIKILLSPHGELRTLVIRRSDSNPEGAKSTSLGKAFHPFKSGFSSVPWAVPFVPACPTNHLGRWCEDQNGGCEGVWKCHPKWKIILFIIYFKALKTVQPQKTTTHNIYKDSRRIYMRKLNQRNKFLWLPTIFIIFLIISNLDFSSLFTERDRKRGKMINNPQDNNCGPWSQVYILRIHLSNAQLSTS